MTHDDTATKVAALDSLYSRIMQIAVVMGGTTLRRGLELLAEMLDDLQTQFAPMYPLDRNLVLQAKRTKHGVRVGDWSRTLGPDGEWTGGPVTDEEIRKCLRHDGPPPLH